MMRFERRDEDCHPRILTNNLPRWFIAGVPLIPFPTDIKTVGLKNRIYSKKLSPSKCSLFYNMPQLRTVIPLYERSFMTPASYRLPQSYFTPYSLNYNGRTYLRIYKWY